MKKFLLLILLILSMLSSHAQWNRIEPWSNIDNTLPGYITYGFGFQHSGYTSEERSNFSPLFYGEVGLYLMPYFAACFGYKGLYYLCIYDKDKHFYGFFYGNFILDVTKLLVDNERNRWTLQIYAGGGAFHDKYQSISFMGTEKKYPHGRLMAAGDIGITGLYRITNSFQLGLEVSTILAWGLYQPQVNAVPGVSIKAVYLF